MKLGVNTAILHDKPLREALEVIASLGLTRSRDQCRRVLADTALAGHRTAVRGCQPAAVPVDSSTAAGFPSLA